LATLAYSASANFSTSSTNMACYQNFNCELT
jgi:hypothetical protein